ncbi:MAG: tellurium resistance protein TerC [Myxococcota bacterium]|nr:tellurium resistance protein TerC [Myxococcota bacterium]
MDLFTFENFASLGVLLFLQVVLGFDNLLYISIESQRAPRALQASVRLWGIVIALFLRVVLLFGIMQLLESFTAPWFEIHVEGVIEGSFTFSTLVFLLGGGFLMYTAVREISHLLAIEHLADEERTPKPAVRVVAMIVMMNLIFSFDSILSALAITKIFTLLAIAIVVSGILMLVLADTVSAFIARNRKYEVLGLFILLIVGVVLLGEGGHEAHLTLFGYPVEPMAKSTFYFSIIVLVAVDILQSGYQKKLAGRRARVQGA